MTQERQSRLWPNLLLGLGVLLCTIPLWGMAMTALGMMRTFNEIARSETPPQPVSSAEGIALAIQVTALGFLAVPVGVVLLVAAVYWRRRMSAAEKNMEDET
ncbi:MAG: MotA/TolQ/ExbB proton channel family protein [Pirellulales bacterium]|nr:MotA/TolQ/ExbB proton channel family protein [Pirellulales bacterium]